MKSKKEIKKGEWENLKIPRHIIEKMREHKEKTKVPLVQQAELALLHYLANNKNK